MLKIRGSVLDKKRDRKLTVLKENYLYDISTKLGTSSRNYLK